MSRIICRIANAVPHSSRLAFLFDRHRERCLKCQADAARLRGVSRDLSGLEGEMLTAPGGLHTQVMATLPTQDASNPRRPLLVRVVARWATGIGVAVATLAAIIGRRSKKS
ncbi:MAG: hypothetical protein V3W36_00310 [Acidimicrobiia bacterium]